MLLQSHLLSCRRAAAGITQTNLRPAMPVRRGALHVFAAARSGGPTVQAPEEGLARSFASSLALITLGVSGCQPCTLRLAVMPTPPGRSPGPPTAPPILLSSSQASLLSERLNGAGLVQQLELDLPALEPLLVLLAAGTAAAAVWPSKRKLHTVVEVVRDVAGRAAFAALSAAIAAELLSGQGLLTLLHIDTGVGAITEAEALLAGLLLLVLTGPRRHAS